MVACPGRYPKFVTFAVVDLVFVSWLKTEFWVHVEWIVGNYWVKLGKGNEWGGINFTNKYKTNSHTNVGMNKGAKLGRWMSKLLICWKKKLEGQLGKMENEMVGELVIIWVGGGGESWEWSANTSREESTNI